MEPNSTTWLVINSASGSHDPEMVETITGALADGGYPAKRVVDCKQDELPDAAMAEREGVTHVVLHGGDGTLNAAITRLEGWDGAILPLPGGTSNLLCHRLFPDCDTLAILRSFTSGELVRRREFCLRGENHVALCEILAGPGALWADVREEMREYNIGQTLAKAIDASGIGDTGPNVVLADPQRGKDEGYGGLRLIVEAHTMRIEGYGPDGLSEFVEQGIAILKRNFREGPHDDLGVAEKAVLRSAENQPIPLMVDGERHTGGAEITFLLAPLQVDLLGPVNG
ncbi:hypothetical protein GRI44_10865 [Altererythrobacter confluentis]|uniref:DAGKc domain-containing protein n=1 Tax=Allopontixanthobacter confluentis TaxID=1849021 RepID=A0A6L7GI55_9SPHN|nr:diacylglycerol kinase family protein [Allopontixanthobacter confluentis]MXP15250.1 hypothetical protein [Allopontixanthobacter confluentis]